MEKRVCGACIVMLSLWPLILPAQDLDVESFVRKIYISGIPYDEANSYTSANVPTLLEMLQDESESPYWGNIVVTLSIIGDDKALDPIIQFIEKQEEEELLDADYRAKSGALLSLGYLINKTGNMRAIDYLVESIDPSVWEKRNVFWRTRVHNNVEARDADLSSLAILGLALSGRPEAAEAINLDLGTEDNLQPVIEKLQPAVRQLPPAVSGLVEAALETYQQVAADGLSEYYRKSASNLER